MNTLRIAFIIALTNVIIISGFVVGWFILAIALLFALLFFTYKFIYNKIKTDNDNYRSVIYKKISSFVATIFIYVIALFTYVSYTINSTPLTYSFLENQKLIRVLRLVDYEYIQGISNYSYAILAENFRQDLRLYSKKKLTKEDKKSIWQNSLKNLILINKIKTLIFLTKPVKIKDKLWRYNIFFYQIPHSFYIDSTKFLVYIGKTNLADIKIEFNLNKKDEKAFKIIKKSGEKLKIYMPYIRKNFFINNKDKELFKTIANYFNEINKNFEENKKFFKTKE